MPTSACYETRPVRPGTALLGYRGYLGFLIIVISEIMMLSGVETVSEWFTPIVWTGYILLMDQVNYSVSGWSMIMNRRHEFLLMMFTSIACWTIFEIYNLYLQNWEYLNLPKNLWVRQIGYCVSFATVFPGVFETFYFLENIQLFKGMKKRSPWRPGISNRAMEWTGLTLLTVPIFLPDSISRYFFGLVWVGFFLLLEPINFRNGFRSVLKDFEDGNYATMLNLLVAGGICGFLWEFWNFWATTKWVYTLPFPTGFKIFEMPALGFLGFFPFAIECYSMHNFCAMRED